MDSTDGDRAIDRFVAGLPVDGDELSLAVSARAVDAKIVVDALLCGLENDSPVARLHAAKRVARMIELAPRLEVRLRQLAATDGDRRVRARASAVLRAHARPVPGEEGDVTQASARLRSLPSLWLRPAITRGSNTVLGSFLVLLTGTPSSTSGVLEYLAVVKMIHEFGHGFTAKPFRGECHEMGVFFLVLTPALYCDVTDSWPCRASGSGSGSRPRASTSSCSCVCVATFVWWNTQHRP